MLMVFYKYFLVFFRLFFIIQYEISEIERHTA